MPDRWRVGAVERAVLEALDELGARPDRPHVKCARVVRRLAVEHGVSPRYGYAALCTLSQPWLQHVALVDFHGNNGSPDDRPANPRYTEARLSRAGAIVLAAERGDGPKVPVALINGDLHVDGFAPPYSPTRVIAALLTIIDNRGLDDSVIVELVGPPASPTGCSVDCDYRVLGAGDQTVLTLMAHLTTERRDTGTAIVVTHLPLGIGDDAVMYALVDRVNLRERFNTHRGEKAFAELALPLRDIRNESSATLTRIVCEPRRGADVADVEAQIGSTWGVRTRSQVQLAAPLAEIMRELVDDDVDAQRDTLARLADCF
jgi:DNA gyrase/topoisomerase IV subunit A